MEASPNDEKILQLSMVWEAGCKAFDCDAQNAFSQIIFGLEVILRHAGGVEVRGA